MRSYLLLLISVACVSKGNAQDSWMQIDSMNGPTKSVTSSFVLNGEGYVVGGLTETDFTRKMYSYNPVQNDWDNELSWGGDAGGGQNRGSAVSFTLNNKAYVGLGQGNTSAYYKDFWEYDPATLTWTQIADFEGSARHGAVGFANATNGFVGTGQSETGLMKDFYKFEPLTNSWTQLLDFPGTARKYAVGFMMGNQGYVATGDDGVFKNDLWQYHPEFDLWVQKTNMPTLGRSGAIGWGIYPSLFVGTGEDVNGLYKNDLWEYNFYTNAWVQRSNVPGYPRKYATAFEINGVAYVGSGFGNNLFQDDFYAYYRVLGLDELNTLHLTVYPNPTVDFITIDTPEQIVAVQVIAINGTLINLALGDKQQLDVRDLANGAYQLVAQTRDGKQIHASFIKQ